MFFVAKLMSLLSDLRPIRWRSDGMWHHHPPSLPLFLSVSNHPHKKQNKVKECLNIGISLNHCEMVPFLFRSTPKESERSCSKLMLMKVADISEWWWHVTKNLTSCVIQVELYLLSSHCDSGNIFFKHWRSIFLFLRHIRSLFDEYILERWPQLIF